MDEVQALQEAQNRLERKRQNLKVTTNPGPNLKSMALINKLCPHGIPTFVKCIRCERDEAIKNLPDAHPQCIHGELEGFCDVCLKIEAEKIRTGISRGTKELDIPPLKIFTLQQE